MSRFDEITGNSEYQRQSWRDSYNGGKAAGDWSGGVNDRLDRERSDFQGATWSGSSSQPSALQWAQMGGVSSVASGHVGSSVTAGSGNSSAVNQSGQKAPTGAGPGNPAVTNVSPSKTIKVGGKVIDGVLTPKDQQLKRIGVGGQQESFGAISDIGWARTKTGWVPVPSSDVKERLEDNVFMELSWFTRNYLTPMFVGGQEFAPDFLDPDYSHYVPALNEWRGGGSPRLNKDGQLILNGGGF